MEQAEQFGKKHSGKIALAGFVYFVASVLYRVSETSLLETFSVIGNKSAQLSTSYFYSPNPYIRFWIEWIFFGLVFFAIILTASIVFQQINGWSRRSKHIAHGIGIPMIVLFIAWFMADRTAHEYAIESAVNFQKRIALIEQYDQNEYIKLKANFVTIKTYPELMGIKKRANEILKNYESQQPGEPARAVNTDVNR